MISIAVITGATGKSTLRRAIQSVQAQTVLGTHTVRVQHWIIIDGCQFEDSTRKLLGKMPVPMNDLSSYAQHVVVLPENTGGSGYLCHRINAALPFLINTDYVCFLDEDNAYEPTHLQHLFAAVTERGARWGHSLRSIVDPDGSVVCMDACESLGAISHTCCGRDDRLIDTNCYLMERCLARELAPLWYVKAREPGRLEADRAICKTLLSHEPTCGISRHHSVRYTVDGRSDSVKKEFFLRGNALFKNLDFTNRRDLYVFHFDAHQTSKYIFDATAHQPLVEWCMTMWDEVEGNLFDGFANMNHLPHGAICLITMCSPDTLPLALFQDRKDLKKIVYTAEGPNIRHATQWTKEFLKVNFDILLTHWAPLLTDPGVQTILAPHNARFLTFPRDSTLLRENTGPNTGRVVMVLERRDCLDTYVIDETPLKCLDGFRETFARGMRDLTVFGNGWNGVPDVTVGYSMPRHLDTAHTPIDHYQSADFALILENCDAEGYVSEKFGDALLAGAIPLYWGNPSAAIHLPPGAYVDIREFQDGSDLQKYLDSLDTGAILAMKQKVIEGREAWLAERGTGMIATAVAEALTRLE